MSASSHRTRSASLRWRRTPRGACAALALALVLSGCSTNPPPPSTSFLPASAEPTPGAVATAIVPATATAVVTPAPTPEPTDDQPLPSTTTTGWWGSDIGSYCGISAWYRLNGTRDALGSCMGVLVDPGHTITVAVGQDLDLHMVVPADGALPRYPLPTSTDPHVIDASVIFDKATMTYRALASGTARLMTVGSCLVKDDSPSGVHAADGPCPVVEIQVPSIPTACTTLADDLCRAAVEAAIEFGYYPDHPGQHIVGWKAAPSSGLLCMNSWRTVVEVTLTYADPASVSTQSIGQSEPGRFDSGHFGVCTY